MSLVDNKIAELIIPDSETNSEAEAYEYYLGWLSPDGAPYYQMFTDFTLKIKIKGNVINTKSSNITKLFENAFQTVQLIAEDLTSNQFDTISKLLRSKLVRRYFRDESFINLAIETNSSEKVQSDNRYNINITVSEIEKALLK